MHKSRSCQSQIARYVIIEPGFIAEHDRAEKARNILRENTVHGPCDIMPDAHRKRQKRRPALRHCYIRFCICGQVYPLGIIIVIILTVPCVRSFQPRGEMYMLTRLRAGKLFFVVIQQCLQVRHIPAQSYLRPAVAVILRGIIQQHSVYLKCLPAELCRGDGRPIRMEPEYRASGGNGKSGDYKSAQPAAPCREQQHGRGCKGGRSRYKAAGGQYIICGKHRSRKRRRADRKNPHALTFQIISAVGPSGQYVSLHSALHT